MNNLDKWHKLVNDKNLEDLDNLLAKDVVFFSPVVFKGQEGRRITALYLKSAYKMFFSGNSESFKYVRELNDETNSLLEFTCILDGIEVNGVDMIQWNNKGQIQEFKVMIRPYKATQLVKEKMLHLLKNISTKDKMKLKLGSIIDKVSLK